MITYYKEGILTRRPFLLALIQRPSVIIHLSLPPTYMFGSGTATIRSWIPLVSAFSVSLDVVPATAHRQVFPISSRRTDLVASREASPPSFLLPLGRSLERRTNHGEPGSPEEGRSRRPCFAVATMDDTDYWRRLQLTREYKSISENPPPYIKAHPSESNILEYVPDFLPYPSQGTKQRVMARVGRRRLSPARG